MSLIIGGLLGGGWRGGGVGLRPALLRKGLLNHPGNLAVLVLQLGLRLLELFASVRVESLHVDRGVIGVARTVILDLPLGIGLRMHAGNLGLYLALLDERLGLLGNALAFGDVRGFLFRQSLFLLANLLLALKLLLLSPELGHLLLCFSPTSLSCLQYVRRDCLWPARGRSIRSLHWSTTVLFSHHL